MGLVLNLSANLTKPGICDTAIQSRLLSDILAWHFRRAFGAGHHAAHVQVFQANHTEAPGQVICQFVLGVPSSIGNTALNPGHALLLATIAV
jgi:hypothetical protein